MKSLMISVFFAIICLFLTGCQVKHVMDMTVEEQDKLGAIHYKNAFDSFFVSKSFLDKIDPKERTKKVIEKRLNAYKSFKIITERYPKSMYTDKAIISMARIEEEYISDYNALESYKKIRDEFTESKYNFEATQKVNELKEKFVWKIEECIYQGEYDNAITAINRIKKILPDFNEAYYYLGLIYEKRGLYEQAIREWKKLKNNPKAHFLLSIAYYDRKLYSRAIKELITAIELDKDNPLYYYNLGVIYEITGDTEKKRQSRSIYLKMAEKNENEIRWVRAIRENN
ncbi:tetratricopeptide repeat protein [Candidatus Poribacteria bacterium]|nr:tetratricopeptide repeat protein [Candidatus Poribacteria bacterium]